MVILSNLALVYAYNKGYRIINGNIYSPNNKLLKNQNSKSYSKFNIYYSKQYINLKVHRLVAFQKYGNKLFEKGIVVRHLDGNPQNNLEENIVIGTASENRLDIPVSKRISLATNAAKHLRKFGDSEIDKIRNEHNKGLSYNKLMEKYNITSKGTMSYLINHKYLSKI